MSFKITTLRCPCCGLEFISEYSHGGSIEHENGYRNIHVFIHKWDNDKDSKEELFLWSINIDLSSEEDRDNTIKVGRAIFNCTLLRLFEKGREDIKDALYERRDDIPEAYRNLRRRKIEEIEKELEKEKQKLREIK